MLGGDLEHAVEDDEEEAVAGDEDGSRRTFTALGRFRGARSKLQEGTTEEGLQEGVLKHTVKMIITQRRI